MTPQEQDWTMSDANEDMSGPTKRGDCCHFKINKEYRSQQRLESSWDSKRW
jgi:hypothetical protein